MTEIKNENNGLGRGPSRVPSERLSPRPGWITQCLERRQTEAVPGAAPQDEAVLESTTRGRRAAARGCLSVCLTSRNSRAGRECKS